MDSPLGVQTLIQSGVASVPSQYIQPPELRPKPSAESAPQITIPRINLFGLEPSHRDSVRESIGRACSDWGAFHVTNHGIPTALLADIKRVGCEFFAGTTAPEKLRYACDPASSASEGFGSRMLERDDTVLDWRDYFNHHTLPRSRRDPGRWPESPPEGYRRAVEEYGERAAALAREILGIVSESLGLETGCLEGLLGEVYQNVVISYYPPCPQPELTLGLQAHSDFGAVTLLIQDDVGGLDVLKDGDWVRVESRDDDDAIVVLLGDQTEIMTNGKYKSAVHRAVTNPSRARLSVAAFHDPSSSAKIFPAPQLVTDSDPARYREVNYRDYVTSWYTKGPEGKRNIDALRLRS